MKTIFVEGLPAIGISSFIDVLNNHDPYERSVISRAAYAYASNDDRYITHRKSIIANKGSFAESIVVYLSATFDGYTRIITGDGIKDKRFDAGWMDRYRYFYETILPFELDIVPFEIPVFDSVLGDRRSATALCADLVSMIEHDRKAQINVVPIRHDGNILVLKRNERKGGFWQTITGGVHIDGTLTENVLREISEELGIATSENNLLRTMTSFSYIGGEGYFLREYVFGYRLHDDTVLVLSDEHVAMEYIDADSAINRVKWDGNKRGIRTVRKFSRV